MNNLLLCQLPIGEVRDHQLEQYAVSSHSHEILVNILLSSFFLATEKNKRLCWQLVASFKKTLGQHVLRKRKGRRLKRWPLSAMPGTLL
jgi:hypothetical protein